MPAAGICSLQQTDNCKRAGERQGRLPRWLSRRGRHLGGFVPIVTEASSSRIDDARNALVADARPPAPPSSGKAGGSACRQQSHVQQQTRRRPIQTWRMSEECKGQQLEAKGSLGNSSLDV